MAKVLVIAEHDGAKLNSGTAKVLACCGELSADAIDVLVAGNGDGLDAVCAQAAALSGVSRVLKNARAENAAPLAAMLAPQVVDLAGDYDYVLGPSYRVPSGPAFGVHPGVSGPIPPERQQRSARPLARTEHEAAIRRADDGVHTEPS